MILLEIKIPQKFPTIPVYMQERFQRDILCIAMYFV